MADHPISFSALDRFSTGTVTADERRRIVRHLLAGCASCSRYLEHAWGGRQSMPPNVLQFFRADYDRAFDELARTAARELGASSAHQALESLALQPMERQELLLRNHPRFHDCNLLIARSHDARFAEAHEMRRQARLAVLAAEGLHSARRSSPVELVEACRTRAWCALGNALRVSGDLNAASRAFQTARTHLRPGSSNLRLRAQVLSQIASLRFDQRQYDESLRLHRKVTSIWSELSDRHEMANGLVKEALAAKETATRSGQLACSSVPARP